MASQFSLHISHLSSGYIESNIKYHDNTRFKASALHTSKLKWKVPEKYSLAGNLLRYTNLSVFNSARWSKPPVLSAMPSSDRDQPNAEDEHPEAEANSFAINIEYNRTDCLVWVIHQAAKSFLATMLTHKSAKRFPELAEAWIGFDVRAWRKRVAYQVAVYASLKAAIEVELFLSRKRDTDVSTSQILDPMKSSLWKCIEDQLKSRSPKLIQLVKTELHRIAELYMPLLKKWSLDYAGSRVAGTILEISCCIAVRKLGSGRLFCRSFSVSIETVLEELMNSSCTLASVNKLHHLASEAGFEEEFLLHFGKKIMPHENIKDIEFWIGLVDTKLSLALHRESVISGQRCDKDQENNLVILGLFAFLGKETRLLLSKLRIRGLDKPVEEFLRYLECGSVFSYPRFSSLPEYQLFMEVVTDELEWLDIYAEYYWKFYDKRRSRKYMIQAKTEILLYTVFTIWYDIFLGLAHYCTRTQRPLNSTLRAFLLQSQSLLSICLEDHWAPYDKSSIQVDMNKFTTSGKASSKRGPHFTKSDSVYADILRIFTSKLKSASTAIWMGTQLLCADISVSVNLVMKKLRGHKFTKRERKKIAGTLADIARLVLVIILMLIPVSAWAHVAIFTAIIKRCIPALIPSIFSSERLIMVKQLKRAKEMTTQARSNTKDAAPYGEKINDIKDDGSSSSANNAEETDPPDRN